MKKEIEILPGIFFKNIFGNILLCILRRTELTQIQHCNTNTTLGHNYMGPQIQNGATNTKWRNKYKMVTKIM